MSSGSQPQVPLPTVHHRNPFSVVWPILRTQLAYLTTFTKRSLSITWSILRWLFWRSELLSAIANDHVLLSEPEKKALDHCRWGAFAKCSKHLSPVGITVTLLVLNFAQIFWGVPGKRDQNAHLNALQFAAKVHELLVISSLSLIVLDYVQFELFRGSGVALGSIFSGFQIGNVGALWKPGLWATASVKQKSTRGSFLCILLMFSITIGALSGPASAVLMLPSLDWWSDSISASEMRKAFASDTGFHINLPLSELLPVEISSSNFLPNDCNFTSTIIPLHCPAGGLPDLLAWDGSLLSFGGPFNVTVTAGMLSRFLQGAVTYSSGPGQGLTYIFQTTSAMVSNLLPLIQTALRQTAPLGLPDGMIGAALSPNLNWPSVPTRFAVSSTSDDGLPAPQTYSLCGILSYELLNDSFETDGSFDTNLHFPLRNTINSTEKAITWNKTAPSSLIEMWRSQNTFAAIWVEPPDLGDETPSIAVAFMGNRSYQVFNDGILPEVYVLTCSIYTGWWPLASYMDTTDTYVHSPSINNPEQTLSDWTSDRANASTMQPVKLDVEWANIALPTNETLGRIYTGLVLTRGSPPSAAFGPTVSMLITDALARYGMESTMTFGDVIYYSDGTSVGSNGGNLTAENSTPFSFTRLRYGYSYSMSGATRRLAAGLLLVHLLMALTHTATAIWGGYIHASFVSLPEIFVLALNSMPTQALANTCAGIARLDTYRLIVKIREISSTHLGLVINDEGAFPAPAEGKLYGNPRPEQTSHLDIGRYNVSP